MLTKNIETMKVKVQAHIAADAVVGGDYWEPSDNAVGGRGCFIGCLVHSDKAVEVTERFGLPEPMVLIAEQIFETLPTQSEKVEFFRAVPNAIDTDGKDLSRAHWVFLADLLRHLPPQEGDVKSVVDRVIVGMDLRASGKPWPDAADAADVACAAYNVCTNRYKDDRYTYVAYTAYTADAAACAAATDDAAYAASAARVARVARVARNTESRRQRDSFLEIIAS